ncbi:MAG TPA: hypothetical protein VFE78_29400 [Gemmataceae bacterium]|jgi:hypothetical protein|nr:hypothetical protein [Gemmataceae bacterium]
MRYFSPPRPHLRLAALAAVVAAWAVAAPVRADWVTATFDTVNPGEVVTIHDTQSSVNNESGWAGQYEFKNASGYLTGNFGGFCIDINQNIYPNQPPVTFQVANLKDAPVPGQSMGQLRANLIGELWSNDYSQALTSSSNAAAFQVAIWEIINETNTDTHGNLVLNVSSGQFWVTDSTPNSTALTTANNWLSGLELDGLGKTANLIALTSTQFQDYVVQAPATATPAPSGLVLGGMAAVSGALVAGWRRLRRHVGGLPA